MVYRPRERNASKPLRWILLDSLIIGGIVFISAMPMDRLPNVYDVYVAVRGFLYAFLIQLAVERGIKPHMDRNNTSYVPRKKSNTPILQIISSLFI